MTSPAFDFSTADNSRLEFDIKMNHRTYSNYGHYQVEYTTDGGSTWNVLGSNADATWYGVQPTAGGHQGFGSVNGTWGTLTDWTRVSLDLCILAGEPCVQFRVATDRYLYNGNRSQFAFDNVRVTTTPHDAQTLDVRGCYGSAYGLDVDVEHILRCTSPVLNDLTLFYVIDGDTNSHTFNSLGLNPGDLATLTIPNVTIPNQTSNVVVWSEFPNGTFDQIIENDSTVVDLNTFPHCNDHCSNAIELGIGTTTASQTSEATVNPAEDSDFSDCSEIVTIENTVW